MDALDAPDMTAAHSLAPTLPSAQIGLAALDEASAAALDAAPSVELSTRPGPGTRRLVERAGLSMNEFMEAGLPVSSLLR